MDDTQFTRSNVVPCCHWPSVGTLSYNANCEFYGYIIVGSTSDGTNLN